MLHYDHIICGAGCSGLSLAVRMIRSGHFSGQKILLIDKAPKNLNDRTWCFWEQQAGYFEAVVHHSWSELWLRHPQNDLPLDLDAYQYKMIRGIDFYQYCFAIISNAGNIDVHYAPVTSIDAAAGVVSTETGQFSATNIYSSVLPAPPVPDPKKYHLLQHFRGWWIETPVDAFDPTRADLMNFRTSQQHGCTFVYVLPVSPRHALVEYTLFTETLLQAGEYDAGLRDFIQQQLKLDEYQVNEVEHGVIPMTNQPFPAMEGRVIYIGTAGGQTKASTGYTFQFIQKQTAAIVASLIKTGKPAIYRPPAKYNFFDSVLLRVLHERSQPGDEVFLRMFAKNKASNVLRFLDNESSFWKDLAIMNSAKKSIFLPAAIKEMF